MFVNEDGKLLHFLTNLDTKRALASALDSGMEGYIDNNGLLLEAFFSALGNLSPQQREQLASMLTRLDVERQRVSDLIAETDAKIEHLAELRIQLNKVKDDLAPDPFAE